MKTVNEIVEEAIASFQAGGLYWYDGVSWLTERDITSADRETVYERVFARLIANGREAGMCEPHIHHNGNGHYVVVSRDSSRCLDCSESP